MRKIILILLTVGFLGSFAVADAATYGPTSNTDKLWQIAVLARPDSTVTTEQTMVAILRANPNSFTNGNINGLKPGSVLVLPVIEDIKKVSVDEAARIIGQQNNAWKKFSSKGQTTDNKLAVKTGTAKKSAASSLANQELLDRVAKLESDMTAVNDNITSTEQEYQTRLTTLEKQNASFQAEIDKLNQQMSQLTAPKDKNSWLAGADQLFAGKAKIGVLIVLGLLLLVILRMVFRRSKNKTVTTMIEKKPDLPMASTDYDFMSGKNGAQTKLDLAQSYIDMGNKELARKLLNEVIESGNLEQKNKAQQLLGEANK